MDECNICHKELCKGEEDLCSLCELKNDEQMINDRERES